MAGSLEGRRIVVTGAASGIGRAAATLFAANGARVIWLDRDAAALAACPVAPDALSITAELSHPGQIQAAMRLAEETLGGLDGLVNAAGIADQSSLDDISLQRWDQILAVNLTAPMLVARACHRALKQSGRASIVNIASASGLRPSDAGAAYSVSKAGLIMLTRSMALEWAPAIRVNAIAPGLIDTPMVAGLFQRDQAFDDHTRATYPLLRMGTADEIAEAALFLISDRSGYVTGSTLAIDGGRSLH